MGHLLLHPHRGEVLKLTDPGPEGGVTVPDNPEILTHLSWILKGQIQDLLVSAPVNDDLTQLTVEGKVGDGGRGSEDEEGALEQVVLHRAGQGGEGTGHHDWVITADHAHPADLPRSKQFWIHLKCDMKLKMNDFYSIKLTSPRGPRPI